jgi:cell division protein FtsW (lipid II flippase)
LILAMVVVLVYSAAVEAGLLETITANFWVPVALLFAIFFGVHIAVRFLAPHADPVLVPVAALINGLGVAFLRRLDLGATEPAQRATLSVFTGMAIRQIQWTAAAAIGAVLLLVVVRDHRLLSRYAYTLGLVGIILLLIPAVLPADSGPITSEVNGAKLWILIGPFSIQPGEFAKLALLCFFAYYLVTKREVLSLASRRFLGIDFPRPRDLGPVLVIWAMSMLVLIFEKDLGASLMYFGMFVVTLYVATERSSWLIIGMLLFLGGAVLGYMMGETIGGPFANFAERVDIWRHPFDSANGNGLQLVQSLLGLGTGGIFGAGPGNGLPYVPQLGRYVVPLVQSDFIFAGMGEEIGLFGLTALLVAYLLIVNRGLRIGIMVRDSFGKLLAGGLSFTLGLQIFVIIGGVTGLIPLTGQTTPFMSAGGSALVANWLLVALLLRISDAARRPATVTVGGSVPPPPPALRLHEAPTEVIS